VPAELFDYVREVNRLCDSLLATHTALLGQKNIHRKRELIQVIKVDLDKLAHALLEVKENHPQRVLEEFFESTAVDISAITAMLAETRIYHVGFEVHEPLDLVLYGIDHWIQEARHALGADMKVKDYLRFPASPAFQKRVGAYTEIMRIWLEVNDRTLMLELFDIHRPVDAELASGALPVKHRNFQGLFSDPVPGHADRMARLFGDDDIWHYALHVRRPAEVTELHAELQALAAHDSTYFLPYAAPVHNPHDGSFHTKVVHRAGSGGRMELEFVTRFEAAGDQADSARRPGQDPA
jgi:hypothetical protein